MARQTTSNGSNFEYYYIAHDAFISFRNFRFSFAIYLPNDFVLFVARDAQIRICEQ